MKMELGVRAHDYGCRPSFELAFMMKAAGFSCCHLAMYLALEGLKDPVGKLNPGLCYGIRRDFEKAGMRIAVLGCRVDPSSPDREQRAGEMLRFREHLLYARQLGANIVGTETGEFGDMPESERCIRFGYLAESVLRMVEAAERCGVFVGIEPGAFHILNTPELTARLLDIVASDHLQIIFDPVNLITEENIGCQDKLYARCFQAFGERIAVMHCKDIRLERGERRLCPLGEGTVDYPRLMRWLRKNRPGIDLIREGADPATAHRDIAFLKSQLDVEF